MYTVLCKKISSCYDKYVHIASNEIYNLKSIKKTAPLPNEVSWLKQGQIVPRKNSREYNFCKGKEKKGNFQHEGNVEKSGLHYINPFISTRQLK